MSSGTFRAASVTPLYFILCASLKSGWFLGISRAWIQSWLRRVIMALTFRPKTYPFWPLVDAVAIKVAGSVRTAPLRKAAIRGVGVTIHAATVQDSCTKAHSIAIVHSVAASVIVLS